MIIIIIFLLPTYFSLAVKVTELFFNISKQNLINIIFHTVTVTVKDRK